MINNYHTLYRWSVEQQPILRGARILEIFCQNRDILSVGIVTAQREQRLLEISVQSQMPFVVLRPSYQRKKKNAVDLLPEIAGCHIMEVKTRPYNRMLEIIMDNHRSMVIELFGRPNVYVIGDDTIILDAFKEPSRRREQIYDFRDEEPLFHNQESFQNALVNRFPDPERLQNYLSSGGLGFNKTLYLEFMGRLASSGEATASGIAYRITQEMTEALRFSAPRIYRKNGEPPLFSVIPLKHILEIAPETTEAICITVNEGLITVTAEKQKYEVIRKRTQDIIKTCKTRIRKNELLMRALEEDVRRAERHTVYETMAHLLSAHFGEIRKGMTVITLKNSFEPDGHPVEIALNPEKSPQENIATYYARSKKFRQSISKIHNRLRELDAENRVLSDISARVAGRPAPAPGYVEKIYQDFVRRKWLAPDREPGAMKKPEPDTPEFREYLIENRWRLFVGQNDEKNDALTFRFAKKDDYWFHARGVPGSHVVLKKDNRSEKPSRSVIETAAAIAAFFSKARTSGLVPVIFTQRKYVRKAKHGRAGQVVIEREDVLMVEPRDPEKVILL